MKYSLRALVLVMLLSGPAIWLARREIIAYREAVTAKGIAELRRREWKSLGTPTTKRGRASERHARLRFERDKQIASQKARQTYLPVVLPPDATLQQVLPAKE